MTVAFSLKLVLARFKLSSLHALRTYSFNLLQVAEGQIDNLQPLVEHLLKESKLLANREGARGDHIHQSLLDLSSRWLKACDEVDKQKKAVRIVPNWYQFRSNMDDIDAWLKKMEQDKGIAVEVRTGSTLVPGLHSAAAFYFAT